ncbi:MAG TPA: family 1 glycosylhydrolase [Polyangia bacterium]|jgi:dTDP-4-dehydrorhamnose reductase|nr:family 1 glycosylhydrolase [Polyangia bacterium]
MGIVTPDRQLELWAGVECTVNRVGDTFIDQIAASGHAVRDEDVELLAWLRVQAARYPVLWERIAPDGLATARWDWARRRLGRLRELGVRPIVGLVHHGSGPRETSLLDPAFPEKLAAYARAVAERFPWVRDWTPVNEPLTTARFSALYGLWYPHRRSLRDCLHATVNQCRGIALAMAAIRGVIQGARLIQTEDFGRVTGTAALGARVQQDGTLRALSIDLLMGRVSPAHPLWSALVEAGVSVAALESFADGSCRPDVLGVNYYVTSDRFLDDRLADYPAHLHGGDGERRFVDVESVRTGAAALTGHAQVLDELARRYGLPLAITEVHLGGERDDQLRWLAEAWSGARAARAAGADVRAVTAWSLLGSFGWDRLVTAPGGAYEPGLFDLRAPSPRPTALASMVRALAAQKPYESPALDASGWWRRPERVLYPAPARAAYEPPGASLLVTGGSGTLARAIARVASRRGLAVRRLGRRELDVTDAGAVRSVLRALRPWAVVNAAGYVRVDDAEGEPERCWHENVTGAITVARAAEEAGLPSVAFSSDLVFDGSASFPYRETDVPRPLNVYGRSKAAAERRILAEAPGALVIRTAALFGPWDVHNFVMAALRAVRRGSPFAAAADVHVSPTYVPDLAAAVLDLLLDGARGIWHVANPVVISWSELARRAVEAAGLGRVAHLVRSTPIRALNLRAPRPAFSALDSQRGRLLGTIDDAIARFVRDCPVAA